MLLSLWPGWRDSNQGWNLKKKHNKSLLATEAFWAQHKKVMTISILEVQSSIDPWEQKQFQPKTAHQRRRQVPEPLLLWQLLRALYQSSRSEWLHHVGTEWHRMVTSAQTIMTPKELQSQCGLTDLLSKTSSSTGSSRISCRTSRTTLSSSRTW